MGMRDVHGSYHFLAKGLKKKWLATKFVLKIRLNILFIGSFVVKGGDKFLKSNLICLQGSICKHEE